RLDLALERQRLVAIGDLAALARLLQRIDLLLRTRGPRRRPSTGDEQVAGVPRLHLDDVTGCAQAFDFLIEDELPGCHSSLLLSAVRGGVREERHFAGVLHGLRDDALFLHGDTGDAASADLAAVRDELAQRRGVLVRDGCGFTALERI